MKWIDPEPVDVPHALRQMVGGHPLVAETLVRRGLDTPQAAAAFLDPDAYTPADAADLPDLARAVARLRQALGRREPVAIWGDFDADGQTATTVLLESLRALGGQVSAYVPARAEGHGLHTSSVQRMIDDGARLLVTCDTGIMAHAAAAYAGHLGAEVIVTDHHSLGESLPPATAVINPHRLPGGHPLRHLAGVGVAYELARGLSPAVADRTLDLVALGTVADVSVLRDENRYLVQRGLDGLRRTDRPGLLALYQQAGLEAQGLSEEHISFVVGPRLNALGRLADAADGVELLTTADPIRARTLATELEGLNAQRQWLTKQVTDAALAQVEREPALLHDYQVLLLSHPTWPAGIVGIVAGRLAERFGRPTVLISAEPGRLARGSGRSIPGVDLIAALSDCAPLLEGYGGHPGAAGFSIEPERIPELRRALSGSLQAQVESLPEPELPIDAYVELPDLSLDLVAEIDRLAPFGRGNPALTLAVRNLHLTSEAPIGRTGEHRRLTVEDAQDRAQTVFWWQGSGWPLPRGQFDLALTLRASDYRGLAEIQVEWIDAREREPAPVDLQAGPAFEVHDYRAEAHPEILLQGLAAAAGVQVWAEGHTPEGVAGHTRQQLGPATRLVLWTLPPGPQEWREALQRVQPEEVALFAHDAGLDEAGPFVERLAGMVRHALRAHEGHLDLAAVAARLGHRIVTVEAGLEWLDAGGQVHVVDKGTTSWQLARGRDRRPGASGRVEAEEARQRLEALLAETAAYRNYLRQVPPEALPT
jgi:single-stranded-DNA-specific exonuclease